MRRLAPGLAKRFGDGFADVGMYPIPILTRDIPGYLITPHTDTRWKGITVQLYLPADDAQHRHRHHLPRACCPTVPSRSRRRCALRATPATPSPSADDTWHSADPVHDGGEDAQFDPADLFRRPGACAKVCATAASDSATSCSTKSGTGCDVMCGAAKRLDLHPVGPGAGGLRAGNGAAALGMPRP